MVKMGFLSTLGRVWSGVALGVLAVYLATSCTAPVDDAVINPEPVLPVTPPVPIAEPEVPVMETSTVVLPPTVEPDPPPGTRKAWF